MVFFVQTKRSPDYVRIHAKTLENYSLEQKSLLDFVGEQGDDQETILRSQTTTGRLLCRTIAVVAL